MDYHLLLCSVEERRINQQPISLSFGRVIVGCQLPILYYDSLVAAAG